MPVNVTEQLVTDDTVANGQVVELRLPPVVPGVRVKVTVPLGEFVAVVVSATVAVTVAVQLVAPRPMLQLISGTLVDVLSFPVLETVIVADALLLPL